MAQEKKQAMPRMNGLGMVERLACIHQATFFEDIQNKVQDGVRRRRVSLSARRSWQAVKRWRRRNGTTPRFTTHTSAIESSPRPLQAPTGGTNSCLMNVAYSAVKTVREPCSARSCMASDFFIVF